MSDRYWIASSGSTWNSTANWSTSSGGSGGSSVPNAGDTAIFDGNGVGDCQMDVALTSSTNIDMQSGYTGTLDASIDNLNHSVGDATFAASGALLKLGNGTWTCTVQWDSSGLGANMIRGSSTIVIGGAVSSVKSIAAFENLTLNASTGSMIVDAVSARGNISLNGAILIDTGAALRTLGNAADIVVNSGATILGNGVLQYSGMSTFSTNDGSVSVTLNVLSINPFPAATYSGAVIINIGDTLTHTFGAGTYTFEDSFTYRVISGRTCTLDMNTNDPNLVFKGDVDFANNGTMNYTKGSGTWVFNNTSAINVGLAGKTVEGVIFASSGKITFTDTCIFNDISGTGSHEIDFNGQDIETLQDFSMGANITATLAGLAGCSITVGNDFTWTGHASGTDLRGTNEWTLDVTGTGTASDVLVKNSDASSGSTITATGDSYDYGGNQNWSGLAIQGDATSSFSALDQDLTGNVVVQGGVASLFNALDQDLVGQVIVAGNAVQQFTAFDQDLVGQVIVTGNAVQQFATFDQNLVGQNIVAGGATQVFIGFDQDLVGQVIVTGNAAQSLTTFNQNLVGQVVVAGNAVQVYTAFNQDLTGQVVVAGNAVQVFTGFDQDLTGQVIPTITGDIAQVFTAFDQDLTGYKTLVGNIAQTLSALNQDGVGQVFVQGNVTQVYDALHQQLSSSTLRNTFSTVWTVPASPNSSKVPKGKRISIVPLQPIYEVGDGG